MGMLTLGHRRAGMPPAPRDVVGTSPPRPDALAKVTGAARYPGDLSRPGQLHLWAVLAGRPHARILGVDARPALAHPGVVAVLTAADVPRNRFGLIEDDQPVLAEGVVRWVGERVALVAAETREAAATGARLVEVTYEDLPVVADPATALAPGTPLVQPGRPDGNLLTEVRIRRGDAAGALAGAATVLEATFTTTWQEHAFLQPEAGVAWVEDDGRVVVETAGQWAHDDRREVASTLGLPDEQVVIRYAAIGGAFGGREDLTVQPLLALAAWTLRRPVALVWDRTESMLGHPKRHPMSIRARWGVDGDGRIRGVEADLTADAGAYASTSQEVVKAATLLLTGAYRVPNVALLGRAVLTNNVPTGAFRGFGAPQAQFAAESMVARLAEAIGDDPVAFRQRNLYREGDLEPTGRPLPAGVGALATLEACAAEARRRFGIGWDGLGRVPGASSAPRQAGEAVPSAGTDGIARKRPRRGVGIACGIKNLGYSFGFPERATAAVELYGRGEVERATVRIGAADVGQGVHLALRQIAADGLRLPLAAVALVADDSAEAPDAGSASASRLTLVAGRAVHDAVAAARAKWPETDDERVEATVTYRPPATTPLDPITGEGTPNYCYGYAAQAVEVEVDPATGVVRVLGVVSAHDVGRAINPRAIEGQVEGGVAQALGYALLEDFRMADGFVLTRTWDDYLLPTALDVPDEIVPLVLETADPNGPFGARGMAELPLVPFLPAVAAAIHDAVGVWLTDQPFTPERVQFALDDSPGTSARVRTPSPATSSDDGS